MWVQLFRLSSNQYEGSTVAYINIKLSSIVSTFLFISCSAMADGDMEYIEKKEEILTAKVAPVVKEKRTLNGNMTLNYNVIPGDVDNIHDLFSEGVFYGRLRSNTFYWEWKDTSPENRLSNIADKNMGMGGSLIYKSASLNHFNFTIGYYGSLNPTFWRPDKIDAGLSRAGKDTFSRYKVKTTGEYGIHTFAQGYVEYNNGTVEIKGGRQFFESVFTKSNDTKMIPNSFDGVSAAVKIAFHTKVRVAWFAAQKLRDHENSHDVITFKDANGERWNNNDDAAGHKGLTYDKFVNEGKDPDHDLYLVDFISTYIKNLKFAASYLQVPGVMKDAVLEAHYKILIPDSGWAVRPGIRYFLQMDDGGGKIAADTNFLGKPATSNGYDAGVVNSLDSSLFNVRLDLLMPDTKGFFRLGYSNVADKADIIAPWRAFPTGGFTRAMAQYNWVANTETFMIRAVYKFNMTWKASIRYAIEDYDDNKDYVLSDANVVHIDTWTNISKNLQMRMRYGHADADKHTKKIHHPDEYKIDWSYDEFRLEFNYLF